MISILLLALPACQVILPIFMSPSPLADAGAVNWTKTWENWEKFSGTLSHLATTLAIIVGSVWALRKYLRGREGVWNLKLSIEHEVVPFTIKNNLLILDIVLENIGKVMIRPGSKGCPVTIRYFPRVDPETPHVLRWENGVDLLVEEDIIGNRPSAKDVPYELEPGAAYKHTLPVVLPKGDLLMVRVTFWWEDNKDAINKSAVIDLGAARPPARPAGRN